MLDLDRLRVSLTKHGAHKIALLLRKYDKDEILSRLESIEPGINIERAQALRNLSASSSGIVPEVWNKARHAGTDATNALVLIAMIFSHVRLIEAMRKGKKSPFRGSITKGDVLRGKEFTNFAHSIEQLGFSTFHGQSRVDYDLRKLFDLPRFHGMVGTLLALKLRTAGWDGKNALAEELVIHRLNEALALTPEQLRSWLATGDVDLVGHELEDEWFFRDLLHAGGPDSPFAFKPGHRPKKTGAVDVASAKAGGRAVLLHNELQTRLYDEMVAAHGKGCVGTEVPTGRGTSIDLVVRTASSCDFYEIKVAPTLTACVRQAIPQLLEYAFWRTDTTVADRLFIASKFSIDADTASYLELLRDRFRLPLYYHQISL